MAFGTCRSSATSNREPLLVETRLVGLMPVPSSCEKTISTVYNALTEGTVLKAYKRKGGGFLVKTTAGVVYIVFEGEPCKGQPIGLVYEWNNHGQEFLAHFTKGTIRTLAFSTRDGGANIRVVDARGLTLTLRKDDVPVGFIGGFPQPLDKGKQNILIAYPPDKEHVTSGLIPSWLMDSVDDGPKGPRTTIVSLPCDPCEAKKGARP
jgi:hypothetical protein